MIKQFLVAVMIAAVISAQAEAQQAGPAVQTASKLQAGLPATNSVSMHQPNRESNVPGPRTQTIKVPRRAGLKFVTLAPLSSETSKVGDDVPLRLDRDLVINNVTVLQAGATVHGRVVAVKKLQKCKNGEVHWNVERIPFPDGSTAKAALWGVGASHVPDRLFHEDEGGESFIFFPAINEWWEVVLSLPIYAVDAANLAIFSPLLLIGLASTIGQDSCTTPGKRYDLAEGSPVAVMVTRTHKVKY